MASPISANPNFNSGRAAAAIPNISYPLNELLTKRTVLRFVEYERPGPLDSVSTTTTAVVNLPIPLQIPETLQIKSGNDNLDFAAARAARLYELSSGNTIKDIINSFKYTFSDDIPKEVARAMALSPLSMGDDRRVKGQIFGGVVKNPHTTAFFDGVQLRTYSLTWKMSARNKEESDVINNIIGTIRERMLPEERLEGYALDFPDLVYVDFEGDLKEYMPQYYKAYISDMTVNSSSGEGMVFYKSGAPVSVELSCTFVETNVITRNILRGDSTGGAATNE